MSMYSSKMLNFYPRPPRGGRPYRQVHAASLRPISIHALREEGDLCSVAACSISSNFYPRPPRGGRPELNGYISAGCCISIHALREEGDLSLTATSPPDAVFLSTPSARRATFRRSCIRRKMERFLSTPSARRATHPAPAQNTGRCNFYPRPPRGGRQQKQRQKLYFQTNYTTFCTNLEEP